MTIKNSAHLTLVALATGIGAGVAEAQPATPVVAPPPPQWQTSAALGVTLTRGNSDTTTLSGSAVTERKWDANDLSLGGDGLYGTTKLPGATNDTETAETLHGFIQYNRNFTEHFYGYGRIDYLHDGIAQIHYRLTLSPGVGYYFIKEKATDLSMEVGPGFISEKIGSRYENFATLRVGEKFHQALSDRARIWQTAEWLPQVDYLKNYIVNLEAGIEADLTKRKNLSLRFTIDDSYNNVPATGHKKNDLKFIASIAYKF